VKGMNEVVRSTAKMRGYNTFLVIIKLDPMATVPDTARARPIYLSSTMRTRWMMRERGLCGKRGQDLSWVRRGLCRQCDSDLR
jgi:hypothetical protein